MSKAPIWHVATDAMIADTTHLDTLEFGAYVKLMMAQWRNNGNPLENNPKRIALMMGVTQAQFKRIWPVVSAFFVVTETTISQERVAKDFKNVIEKIKKNKQNGSKGGTAKALKTKKPPLANATKKPEQKATIPEPEPYKEKELSKDSSKKPPSKPKGKSNAKRGKRIEAEFGDDWTLPEKYLAYAISKGFTEAKAKIEFEKFTNYWRAKSGANAVKRDWLATWRSWILNASEWHGGNGSHPNGPTGDGGSSIMDITAEIIAERGHEDA